MGSLRVLDIREASKKGAWVAQSVECPTPDFGSGHDPRVVGSSPVWTLLEILCLSLSLSLSHTCDLSLSLKNEREGEASKKHSQDLNHQHLIPQPTVLLTAEFSICHWHITRMRA